MKTIIETIQEHEACHKPYFSFEVTFLCIKMLLPIRGQLSWCGQFFPPVTDQGTANLCQRMERMSTLRPSWASITWGAGGSTDAKSLHLAQQAQLHTGGIPACLHLTCTNMEKTKLDASLQVSSYLPPQVYPS